MFRLVMRAVSRSLRSSLRIRSPGAFGELFLGEVDEDAGWRQGTGVMVTSAASWAGFGRS